MQVCTRRAAASTDATCASVSSSTGRLATWDVRQLATGRRMDSAAFAISATPSTVAAVVQSASRGWMRSTTTKSSRLSCRTTLSTASAALGGGGAPLPLGAISTARRGTARSARRKRNRPPRQLDLSFVKSFTRSLAY
eukprot:scaffold135850_cov33-Tisochrysis_lutea.AAC.1